MTAYGPGAGWWGWCVGGGCGVWPSSSEVCPYHLARCIELLEDPGVAIVSLFVCVGRGNTVQKRQEVPR